MNICTIKPCKNEQKYRNMCRKHWGRWKRNGDPNKLLVEMHGMHKTSEYTTWVSMKQRCNNPNNERYSDYGGRGIKVCAEWENSFTAFFNSMGYKPSPSHSIERIDNNKGYSQDNCKWATPKEQSKNKRPVTNTGIQGVSFCGRTNKYLAYVYHDNTKHYLKRHKTIEEAISAVDKKRAELGI